MLLDELIDFLDAKSEGDIYCVELGEWSPTLASAFARRRGLSVTRRSSGKEGL